MEKLKMNFKALTREQMKSVMGGDDQCVPVQNIDSSDPCTCIAPNNDWLCTCSGCAIHSDGSCTSW